MISEAALDGAYGRAKWPKILIVVIVPVALAAEPTVFGLPVLNDKRPAQ